MSGATNNSNHESVLLHSSGITSVEIYSNQRNNTFYVGEDATITAKYSNPFVVLYTKWQFNDILIDTTLPKYAGTRTENNKELLIIRNCRELDAGEYSIVAKCKANVEICSEKLKLEVIKGPPDVEFNEEISAIFNKHAEIQATIRSFPKHESVIWKKGEKTIDLSLPKYAGSSDVGDRPVLCINNVEEEDGDVYTIEVQNEKGKRTCSGILKVIGDFPEVEFNKEISAVFNKHAEIQATIRSFPKHDSVIWKKGEKEKTIDLSLPKYAGSSDVGDRPVLCINNVEEEDGDFYTIEVQNEKGKGKCCGKLTVIEDLPAVKFNEELSANFNKHAEIQATIRSFPKHESVIWKKGEKTIDLSLPKYAGSSDVGDRPVLCINNVEEEDGDVYTIEVQNEKGKGICCGKLDIIRDFPEVEFNKEISAVFNKHAEIQATIRSFPKHESVIWKKGEKTIDLSLPKYAGSSDDGDRPVLCINNVEEEDGDVYTLEVQNEKGKGTCCGKLVVFEDFPDVALNKEFSAVFNKCAEIQATIRSFPKHESAIWKKGEKTIDLSLPKYAGSSDVGDRPVLCINNVKEEDGDVYTIEVQNKKGKRTCSGILKVIGDRPEVTLNEELAAVFQKRTEIIASIQSFPKHKSVIWKKGKELIDITLPKYAGSSAVGDRPILCISNIEEEDEDVYTIEVENASGKGICSEKLVVFGDFPQIELNEVPSAVFNENVELKAKIRSFPKHNGVIWKKGEERIDITRPKYAGSSDVGDRPVLCINNVKAEDRDVYTIEVQNELGKRTCSRKLVVVGVHQMIFISGPVVVSSSDTIILHALVLDQNYANAKWWKIKNRLTQEIEFDDKKYVNKIPYIKIHEANQEDSAAYQMSLGDMKSNIINIFVDGSGKFSTSNQGNSLRLFALQAVSADAMREVFKNEADFKEKKEKLQNDFKIQKINDLKSRLKQFDKNHLKWTDADISLMYSILRHSGAEKPKSGWGNLPQDNDKSLADDLERIRHYRNIICHSDASGIKTDDFNKSVLDLVGAIKRLSKDNVKLIEATCDILNRVFTKGKDMETMMEKLEDYKKEQKLNEEREQRINVQINIMNKEDCTSATNEDLISSGACLIL